MRSIFYGAVTFFCCACANLTHQPDLILNGQVAVKAKMDVVMDSANSEDIFLLQTEIAMFCEGTFVAELQKIYPNNNIFL